MRSRHEIVNVGDLSSTLDERIVSQQLSKCFFHLIYSLMPNEDRTYKVEIVPGGGRNTVVVKLGLRYININSDVREKMIGSPYLKVWYCHYTDNKLYTHGEFSYYPGGAFDSDGGMVVPSFWFAFRLYSLMINNRT